MCALLTQHQNAFYNFNKKLGLTEMHRSISCKMYFMEKMKDLPYVL